MKKIPASPMLNLNHKLLCFWQQHCDGGDDEACLGGRHLWTINSLELTNVDQSAIKISSCSKHIEYILIESTFKIKDDRAFRHLHEEIPQIFVSYIPY